MDVCMETKNWDLAWTTSISIVWHTFYLAQNLTMFLALKMWRLKKKAALFKQLDLIICYIFLTANVLLSIVQPVT